MSRLSLTPGQHIRTFWEGDHFNEYERELKDERARVTSDYLQDCDFVLYCYNIPGVTGEPCCPWCLISDLELWLGRELGAYAIRSRRRRELICYGY